MVDRFRLDGPLPTGTLLLESSAGTGKTFTIAALAVRFVVERDVPIGRMLMITFGNKAAAELRARVFTAIESCAAALRGLLAGSPVPDMDPVARLVAGLDDTQGALAKLERALDDFDEAMILTTHSFSQWALARLGILGDADHAERTSHAVTLIDECTADVYVQRYADADDVPFDFGRASWLGRACCRSTLPLEPADGPEASFGHAVRDEFARRKRDQGLVTFDDLITRLRDVLQHVATGDAARAWLQERFDVVLVDEFQDTDPEQWKVIERAFVGADRPTILIGDPKQSIYGFRSADIVSYLDARRRSEVRTLGVNHRSDRGIVDGVVELMRGLRMGDEAIEVTPVDARHPARLSCPPTQRVWIRRVQSPDPEAAILSDVVQQVHHILGTTIEGRPTQLSDIAVLVRTSRDAERVARALGDHGYPAVLFGGLGILSQPAARDWRLLLRALDPSDDAARRVVALTDLVGASVAELATTGGATAASDLLRRSAAALASDGPGAAFDVVREGTGLEARLLGTPDGARYLTDLAHIADLLEATGERDPLALLPHLEPDADETDDGGLRLSTDSPAVKVMTLHAAKGLEYPIVLLPDLSPLRVFLNKPFNFVDGGRRCLWLRPERPETRIGQMAVRQARDEELRLLYVGLTRAKHLAIAWHANDEAAEQGPLSAALLRDRDAVELEDHYPWAAPPQLAHVLVTDVLEPLDPPRWVAPGSPPRLRLATMTREVDQQWRRTSYTGLTQGVHDAPSGADEPDASPDLAPDEALSTPAPMGSLPSGAAFGTLVHEALEVLDWSRPGLTARCRRVVGDLAVTLSEPERTILADGLEAVVTTPLAGLADVALADIPLTRRLPELAFDLPMASRAGATVGALAALMAEHLPADDPLAAYPARLAASDAAERTLTGLLTGSIDAVLQLDDGKFVVVDYKTNRLAPSANDVLTLGHYTPAAMASAMMAAHYPLQAILYAAALHRHLGLRLRGYDPDTHLGGVGYLFVRGMAGPDTPRVDGGLCGVCTWHPSAALVVAVSELLGGAHA